MCRPIAHTTPYCHKNLPLPLFNWRNGASSLNLFKAHRALAQVRALFQEAVKALFPRHPLPGSPKLREPWQQHADCDGSSDSGRTHSICPIWLSICQTQIRFVRVSIFDWHTRPSGWVAGNIWQLSFTQGCLFKARSNPLSPEQATHTLVVPWATRALC